MGMYTDLFIADRSEAAAIASIVADERDFEDWPHLQLKDVTELDFASLWGIIRGVPESFDFPSGEPLLERHADDGGSIYVFSLESAFVADVANCSPNELDRFATEWNVTEGMAGWIQTDVNKVLQELAAFARRAIAMNKPVLQLAVM